MDRIHIVGGERSHGTIPRPPRMQRCPWIASAERRTIGLVMHWRL